MPTEPILEPTDQEVLQEEYIKPEAIPVCIDTPVQVRELPTKFAAFYNFPNVPTTAIRILTKNPLRKRALLNSLDQDMVLGSTQGQATAGVGMRWPANVPLPIDSFDEVWVSAFTGTTTISVMTENWAD